MIVTKYEMEIVDRAGTVTDIKTVEKDFIVVGENRKYVYLKHFDDHREIPRIIYCNKENTRFWSGHKEIFFRESNPKSHGNGYQNYRKDR